MSFNKEFWQNQRVVVTGGAGFLGTFVVEKLAVRGVQQIFVPRSKNYDLRTLEAIQRMLTDTHPRWSFTWRRASAALARIGTTPPIFSMTTL